MATRKKPVEGHKCSGVRYMAQVSCECGWESSVYSGKGARGQCYAEWHMHVDGCQRGQPILCNCRRSAADSRACENCTKNDHAACGRCNIASRQKGLR
jgi:hypothetical protein